MEDEQEKRRLVFCYSRDVSISRDSYPEQPRIVHEKVLNSVFQLNLEEVDTVVVWLQHVVLELHGRRRKMQPRQERQKKTNKKTGGSAAHSCCRRRQHFSTVGPSITYHGAEVSVEHDVTVVGHHEEVPVHTQLRHKKP